MTTAPVATNSMVLMRPPGAWRDRIVTLARRLAMVLALSSFLGACTSMHPLHVGPAELSDLDTDEGIVFGSVRVEVTDEESGGMFGRNAKDFRYRVTLLGPKGERDESLFTDHDQNGTLLLKQRGTLPHLLTELFGAVCPLLDLSRRYEKVSEQDGTV